MNIIAFDPGLTVGYAIFMGSNLERCGHLKSIEDIVHCPWNYIDQIVYEGFARGNSVVDEQLRTIEMCGAIQAVAYVHNLPYRMQYPAMRKGYVPIAKCMVKDRGFYLEEVHHAIDAIAHGLCYMDKEGISWNKQFWMHKAFPSDG